MKPVGTFISICAAALLLAPGAAWAQTKDAWKYDLVPYIWGSGLDGTVGVGLVTTDVNAGISDLVEFVDIGGSIRFEARSNPWGWFAEGFFVRLEDEQTILASTVAVQSEQTIAEAGLIHRVTDSVEAYLGVRYQGLDTRIDFPMITTAESDVDWMDGIIGLRWTPIRSEKWVVWMRGDIGTGGSNFVWLASVGGGYRFNKTLSVLAGYRYLDTDFEGTDLTWDMTQAGFGIGLGISW